MVPARDRALVWTIPARHAKLRPPQQERRPTHGQATAPTQDRQQEAQSTPRSPKTLIPTRGGGSHARIGGALVTQGRPACDLLGAAVSSHSQKFRDGKEGVIGFLVGQLMQKAAGAANPKLAQELLRERLQG